MDTKKQRNKYSSAKHTGRMAIFSLFCAAAGVYAADTDGWKYKDAEKTVIENTGTSNVPRIAPIAKDGKFDDDSSIGSVSKIEMSGKADFVYDIPSLKDDPLNGIIFDGMSNSLEMTAGSSLNVDASIARDGKATDGRDAVGIEFSADAESAIITGSGVVDVKASKNATAISGNNIDSIDAKSISAEGVKEGNASTVIVGGNVGNISAETISAKAETGNAVALNVSGNASDITVGDLTASSTNGESVALNVEGNAGNILVETTTGTVAVKGDISSVAIDTANGDVSLGNVASGGTNETVRNQIKAITGKEVESYSVAVNTVQGDISVNKSEGGIYINNVDGKLTASDAQAEVFVNNASSLDVNLVKSRLNATTVVGDATVNGEGIATISSADSVTVGNLQGELNVAELNTANVSTLDGNAIIGKNTSTINVDAISGKLTASDAKGDVNVTTSAGAIDATLNGGNLVAETVTSETKVNGTGNATINNANTVTTTKLVGDMTIGSNSGEVNVDEISGTLTANDAM